MSQWLGVVTSYSTALQQEESRIPFSQSLSGDHREPSFQSTFMAVLKRRAAPCHRFFAAFRFFAQVMTRNAAAARREATAIKTMNVHTTCVHPFRNTLVGDVYRCQTRI